MTVLYGAVSLHDENDMRLGGAVWGVYLVSCAPVGLLWNPVMVHMSVFVWLM